jgi:son of sevenless-like protein
MSIRSTTERRLTGPDRTSSYSSNGLASPMKHAGSGSTWSAHLTSTAAVHEAIGAAEDALLSVIAAFIGHIHSHHISSHPSSHAHLIELTRETIDSVRELLTIVEAVGRNVGVRQARPREIENLRVAKDNLYEVASRLVEASEVVANAPFSERGEDGYDVEKSRLLQAATGTLRAGTDCVRLVKMCLPEDEIMPDASRFSGLDMTPRQSDRQSISPQPLVADQSTHATRLRDKVVGARGVHTLSGLHRKVTSLSQLQKRYQQDGSMVPAEEADEDDEDAEDQEIVRDLSMEEDLTVTQGATQGFNGSVSWDFA